MKWKLLAFVMFLGFGVRGTGDGDPEEDIVPGDSFAFNLDHIINSDVFSVILGTAIVLGGYYLLSKLKVGYQGRK